VEQALADAKQLQAALPTRREPQHS